MRKVGAAAAVLLLILVVVLFRPRGHGPDAQPPSGAGALTRACARQVINESVRDDRVLSGHGRECYQSALDAIGDENCLFGYRLGTFCDELRERLRSSD